MKTRIENNQEMDKGFYKRVFLLTLPIIIQNLIVSLLNMMDTLMIGKVGEVELASVGIANQYFFMFTLVLFGINAGGSIFVSQFWGRHDVNSIKKVTSITLTLSIVVSLIFAFFAVLSPNEIIGIFNTRSDVISFGSQYLSTVAFSYLFTAISLSFAFSLRSIENTIAPMVASIMALAVNVILNYILIFGKFGFPQLGVKGAAIATNVARVIECLVILVVVYRKIKIVNFKWSDLKAVNRSFFSMTLKGMVPVIISEMVWGIGNLSYNIIYARMGVGATASTQITTTIMNLLMIVIMGLGSSSMIVVGKEIGAGQKEQGILYAKRMYRLAIGVGLMIAVVVFFGAQVLVAGFKMSESVLHSSAMILRIYSGLMIFKTYNFIMIVGILRGGGDSKYALIVQGATMWFIGIPMAFIAAFVLKLPIYAVVGMCTAEEVIKMIFLIYRFHSGKWIHNLTGNH